MHPLLTRNLYFVKEHIGFFKAANNYDILDPESGQVILHCREPKLGIFTKIFRFTDYKRMTPFDVRITTPDGTPVLRVHRGFTLLRSKVMVTDGDDQPVGFFRQKLLSIGGAFRVCDNAGTEICALKGKWTGFEYKFVSPDGGELAMVTKKWMGLGKELFTTADNYVLKIDDNLAADHPVRMLIMGAVMCIDMVLKE